jgi:hypothetical protein
MFFLIHSILAPPYGGAFLDPDTSWFFKPNPMNGSNMAFKQACHCRVYNKQLYLFCLALGTNFKKKLTIPDNHMGSLAFDKKKFIFVQDQKRQEVGWLFEKITIFLLGN